MKDGKGRKIRLLFLKKQFVKDVTDPASERFLELSRIFGETLTGRQE